MNKFYVKLERAIDVGSKVALIIALIFIAVVIARIAYGHPCPGEGKYLGNLNANKYDPDSVANPYGQYGSKYSPDSINNPYGQYGNPTSPNSATNPYATGDESPRIILPAEPGGYR